LDVARIVAIDEPNDPRIAAYRDIREADLVGREGHFVAEGEVVVRVLLTASRHKAVSLLLAEKRVAALQAEIEGLPDSVPAYIAPQEILDEIAGFPMHRGILALGRCAAFPSAEEQLAGLGGRTVVLVLFAIANHDNMGGIFRNAAAFGADFVILDSDCCDPLYRKAIRVSAGNVLRVPYTQLDRGADALALLAAHGFEAIALSPDGASTLVKTRRPDRVAILLGAEGPGLPRSILARATTVRIPMAAGVDSLNVATASGIVLHHFAEDRLMR
jgi:tRNA G18 (ribose-2'-O)-methylase SpoU